MSMTKFATLCVVALGLLTGSMAAPAFAHEGGGPRPGQTGQKTRECTLHKNLEKHEIRVTALQLEYNGLLNDLKSAKKGSKEETRLNRKIKKVGKRLSKERAEAADLYRQVKEQQIKGFSC